MAVFKKKKVQNDESRYMASQWKLMWIKLKSTSWPSSVWSSC